MVNRQSQQASEDTSGDPPIPAAIQRIANSDDRRLAWQFFVFFSRMEYAQYSPAPSRLRIVLGALHAAASG